LSHEKGTDLAASDCSGGCVPAGAQILAGGLDLATGVTVLTGENGTGKSTVVELVALLHDLGQAGAQVIVATHSPVVAAVPGARILELGGWGIRPARWGELELVASWRQFLGQPQSFLQHLLDQPPA
jgi:predicted ATPase